MFLRRHARKKNGKRHRYGSVVESRRGRGGRSVQRQVLYLGEINDSQEAAIRRRKLEKLPHVLTTTAFAPRTTPSDTTNAD